MICRCTPDILGDLCVEIKTSCLPLQYVEINEVRNTLWSVCSERRYDGTFSVLLWSPRSLLCNKHRIVLSSGLQWLEHEADYIYYSNTEVRNVEPMPLQLHHW